jgi:hypothetical protein
MTAPELAPKFSSPIEKKPAINIKISHTPVQIDLEPTISYPKQIRQAIPGAVVLISELRKAGSRERDSWTRDIVNRDSQSQVSL